MSKYMGPETNWDKFYAKRRRQAEISKTPSDNTAQKAEAEGVRRRSTPMADYTEKRAQSEIVAQMIKLSDDLDLDIMHEIIREQTAQVETIMPIMDPTRWMREHKGIEAALDVFRAARDFARVVRASKNPAGREKTE